MSDEKNEWGKKIGNAAIWVIALVVAYIAVYTFRTWSTEDPAETILKELQVAAAKNSPELSQAEGIQREATKRAGAMVESQSGDKQANVAASVFWGFLFVNTRSRPQFCKELGVDIAPFVDAFQRIHTAEIAKAQAIFTRNSSTTPDQLFAKLEPQLRKTMEIDMEDLAASQNLSMLETCRLISVHGIAIANEMRLSKMQPSVHKALMAAK